MSLVGPIGTSRKTFNITRQVNLDQDTLRKIAEALGIPRSEQERIISISGEIAIGPAPRGTDTAASSSSAPGGDASPTSSGGNPPASGTTGGGRQSE
jgi:hypothetical protein